MQIGDSDVRILCASEPRGREPLAPRESEALESLYRRYSPDLIAVARRLMGNQPDAEDVVHDVFVRLPASIQRYRAGNFGGWLRTVTTRVALMRLRSVRRRREDHVLTLSAYGACRRDVDPDIAAVADRELLWRTVAQLPASLREVTRLRYLSDYSHVQIGEALGITATASEVRLCRALKRLRALLEERDGSLERSA